MYFIMQNSRSLKEAFDEETRERSYMQISSNSKPLERSQNKWRSYEVFRT